MAHSTTDAIDPTRSQKAENGNAAPIPTTNGSKRKFSSDEETEETTNKKKRKRKDKKNKLNGRRHSISKPARDVRDDPSLPKPPKPEEGSRSSSPFIDFDGLSRPSMSPLLIQSN